MMNKAIISLGSNIAPLMNINIGLIRLARRYTLLRYSSLLQTYPVKVSRPQPMFINTGCILITQQNRTQLVRTLKNIETSLGRYNRSSDMPRTIDLDLLVWNNDIVDEDVYTRDFLRIIVIELMPHLAVLLARRAMLWRHRQG